MRRPNILLLHCHDIGRFLGCYGVATVRTPTLDALAADGVAFARAFATAPQCSPSRASLFTGRYPHSNGVLGLTHEDFAWDLHPDERHIAAELRDAGYRTGLVGVHHESRTAGPDQVAARLGFDTVQLGGLADTVSDRAVSLLREYADDARAPFYLQVGYLEPHRLPGGRDEPGVMGFLGDHIEPDDALGVGVPPYLVDDAGARAEVAELQGAARHMDAAVGRVLAALDETGLADDTIVVFTTDHGVALPRAKCTLYDPGLEVAFMVRWPGRGWTGGRWLNPLVSNVDIMPTLLAAVGVPVSARVQGRSLLPLLDGDPGFRPREEIFGQLTYHDYYDPRRCVRTETHKLVVNFSSAPSFMDSSQSWKRRATPKVPLHGPKAYHPVWELYDLRSDPHELTDLAADPAHATTLDDLRRRLYDWMTTTNDPILTGAVAGPLHHLAVDALKSQ